MLLSFSISIFNLVIVTGSKVKSVSPVRLVVVSLTANKTLAFFGLKATIVTFSPSGTFAKE